jgi:hypothetical protein
MRTTDPLLPLIIVTGLATPSEVAEARRLGVTGIMGKPQVLKRFTEASRLPPSFLAWTIESMA